MNLLAVLARLSSMTMLSRVLGFIRDAVVARVFGAGAAMDAFVVAFRLPNLLRRIFAEGAFSQAFVPVHCDGDWCFGRAGCDLADGQRPERRHAL